MSGSDSDGVAALERHPNVKRVTPHKMVTRTLKYVSVGEAQLGEEQEDEKENSIHRRSLSLVSASYHVSSNTGLQCSNSCSDFNEVLVQN